MNASAPIELETLRGAIGRSIRVHDILTTRLVQSFRATLQDDASEVQPGDPAPPGIHWCLAPPIAPLSALGRDGHPAHGTFLPEIPLPRRMWAGGTLSFHEPLRVGDTVERVSRITDVAVKQGRTGTLCFATIAHEVLCPQGLAIEERQDLVFRSADSGGTAVALALAPRAEWERAGWVNSVILFRYSALTFNSHRIHYDAPYVTEVEHYSGLVVHGPLQASWLLDFASGIKNAVPKRFTFRAVHPLVSDDGCALGAAPQDSTQADTQAALDLWVRRADGAITMRAEAFW